MAGTQDFTGCVVQVFGEDDSLLFTGKVRELNEKDAKIKIEGDIPRLKESAAYRVYIIAPPIPREYKGRLRQSASGYTTFALSDRKHKEIRKHKRHDVRKFAVIERMVFEGRSYALHTPADVLILNVSKGGIKLRAPYKAMQVGNKLEIRVDSALMLAEVRNAMDVGRISTDYGCCFCVDERAERVD